MIASFCTFLLLASAPIDESTWSEEATIRHGGQTVVRLQAQLAGEFLIVRAKHQRGWHTYAMDNERRALEALQGKQSLGIEQGIRIEERSGLEFDRGWLQSRPKDFSKPELRWYTYGFQDTAYFARRLKGLPSESVVIRIRGQACSGDTCCLVDVELKVPKNQRPREGDVQAILKDLVPVKNGPQQP